MHISVNVIRTLVAMMLIMGTSACGNESRSAAPVIATVNGGEITADLLHSAAGSYSQGERAHDPETHDVESMAAHVLERMIDQELLVQKAYELKLDREPATALALENLTRQFLARAYVERLARVGERRGEAEVKAFYRANPLLFQRRSLYALNELAVAIPEQKQAQLRARIKDSDSIEPIAAWLGQQDISFTSVSATRPAEHLPFELLPQLAAMKQGQIEMFPVTGGVWVVQLLARESAPLAESQVAHIIERFLAQRQRVETASAEISRLRSSARIEYAGEYRRPRESGASGAVPATEEGRRAAPTVSQSARGFSEPPRAPGL